MNANLDLEGQSEMTIITESIESRATRLQPISHEVMPSPLPGARLPSHLCRFWNTGSFVTRKTTIEWNTFDTILSCPHCSHDIPSGTKGVNVAWVAFRACVDALEPTDRNHPDLKGVWRFRARNLWSKGYPAWPFLVVPGVTCPKCGKFIHWSPEMLSNDKKRVPYIMDLARMCFWTIDLVQGSTMAVYHPWFLNPTGTTMDAMMADHGPGWWNHPGFWPPSQSAERLDEYIEWFAPWARTRMQTGGAILDRAVLPALLYKK